MATINLSISAETPDDLASAIEGLAHLFQDANFVANDEPAIVTTTGNATMPEGLVVSDVQMAEPVKPKRGGRPKGSLNKPKPEVVEPTPEVVEVARNEMNKIEAEAAKAIAETPVDVAVVAPLPPTQPEPVVAPPEKAPAISVTDVRDALKVLVDAKGRDSAMKILRDLGYEKLSDLPEQSYKAVIKAALAGAK